MACKKKAGQNIKLKQMTEAMRRSVKSNDSTNLPSRSNLEELQGGSFKANSGHEIEVFINH